MGNIPMTHLEEILSVHSKSYLHSLTFTELKDQRIPHDAGTTFNIYKKRYELA